MRFKLFILIPILLFFQAIIHGQVAASSEASINLGYTSFHTDFGQEGIFSSSLQSGFAVGASLYINFFNRDPLYFTSPNWMQKHLKLKVEGSYLSANLDYLRSGYDDIKDITGKSKVINFGGILEYHPMAIPDFVTRKQKMFEPYFGFGVLGGYSMPGQLTGNTNKPAFTGDAINTNSTLTISVIGSGGFRVNLGYDTTLLIDMRWQRFFSDYIDGMSPNKDVVPTNTANDWLYYLNVGYVFDFGPGSKTSTWFKRR